ncbi:hypothetical protein NLG97_g725 [Lecanicillium saksenae]|uniref:Uncharacterized protein n=1 Tax=Lecanicillium saksenae TaxID=468837 RepID=A0ACC1R603_9HYPO|nr:hypothetical protein NLG97_g725 [Lecanicillium saksenae]
MSSQATMEEIDWQRLNSSLETEIQNRFLSLCSAAETRLIHIYLMAKVTLTPKNIRSASHHPLSRPRGSQNCPEILQWGLFCFIFGMKKAFRCGGVQDLVRQNPTALRRFMIGDDPAVSLPDTSSATTPRRDNGLEHESHGTPSSDQTCAIVAESSTLALVTKEINWGLRETDLDLLKTRLEEREAALRRRELKLQKKAKNERKSLAVRVAMRALHESTRQCYKDQYDQMVLNLNSLNLLCATIATTTPGSTECTELLEKFKCLHATTSENANDGWKIVDNMIRQVAGGDKGRLGDGNSV